VAIMAERARGHGRSSLTVVLLVLTGAAALSGALVFAAVAEAGALFPPLSRGLVASVAAVVLISTGFSREEPVQWNAETPSSWLERENLLVAAWNGLALGAGFVTRLGFWLWWMLPLVVFETASAPDGLLVGAAYGLTRVGLSSVGAATVFWLHSDVVARTVMAHRRQATLAADPLFFCAAGIALTIAARITGVHL
jgi:hypothetical protein